MYIPSHFKVTDETLAYDIIKEHSFATLFSGLNGMPFATHLPLILTRRIHTYMDTLLVQILNGRI